MNQAVATPPRIDSLTALLLPLADRTLLLPNVAVAEIIPYRGVQTSPDLPPWLLGQLGWRDLRLPLLSFEAASGGRAQLGATPRVAVFNALGGRPRVKFLALLLQGIPHSLKVDAHLARVDAELAPLELAAVQVGDGVARIPDLQALEQKLADAGLI
ncbi:chemotaxis protein CheW [Azotobacter beijerinckii]|uniref:Chemosensory pili system protein ChpC n=1 Tax=Azotobacter beijerinckii TaxID=170623 RepID=A0A1I4A3U5_9GAMM|nr:chemotaxis protein CheW [Azotobacter beijerinckii]SFA87554.1 chemosensory pili system protein ChpC [Azotobacter beijerinckii]SFK51014.1 chemosensory pili system protein ChpC [Azotobacter beijerinckii]